MNDSYWSRVLKGRINRRRAVLGAGGFAAASAFLAACGGDDDEPAPSGGTSGGSSSPPAESSSDLLTPIVDSTDQAVQGGTFVWAMIDEPEHLDGIAGGTSPVVNVHQGLSYEALVRNKPGIGLPSTWSEVVPQLAEGWEVSGDKLTITFKLRQGVKFHDKPPVNGRELDAEDFVATWRSFEELSSGAAAHSNNLNPSAPIKSVTATDKRTVVIELARPHAAVLQRVANTISGAYAVVYPKEYGSTFEARADTLGTGPYMLDDFQPSVKAVYKRNPEYWDKKAAFLDEISLPLLPEYATRLAQLRTGSVSAFQVAPLDVVPTKKATPGLAMYSITDANSNPVWTIRYGWMPIEDKPSPFLDIRVRQAISMALDRDLYIDVFGNVSNYKAEGLPVNTYWHSSMGYLPEIHLDPRDSAFGENAKFYEHNPQEAMTLMAAAKADYPGGEFPEMPFYLAPGQVPEYAESATVLVESLNDIGFNLNLTPLERAEYFDLVARSNGKRTGIGYHGGVAASRTAVDYFVWRFYSQDGGTGFLGIGGPDGSAGDQSGDPEVDSLIEKLTAEYDPDASRDIMHELQRYLAFQAYAAPRPGIADTFVLAWPAIKNFASFQGDTRVSAPGMYGWPQYWFDASESHGS